MIKVVNIEGFTNYTCSELGVVKNTVTGNTMKTLSNKHGYKRVTLCQDGIRKHLYVHRIVAFTFLECPGEDYEVHHKDNNRQNNVASNLEWVTHAENMAHVHSKEELGDFAINEDINNDLPF